MSPLACKQRTEVISVVCSLSVSEMASDVKALEEQIITLVQQSGREFYAKVFAAFQQRWLEEARREYTAVRWRSINQVTPFGLLRLPVRVVRARGDGRYFTLSKASSRVTDDTSIFRMEDGKKVAGKFSDLKVGQTVEASFTGPVSESYPVQGAASEIVISQTR